VNVMLILTAGGWGTRPDIWKNKPDCIMIRRALHPITS